MTELNRSYSWNAHFYTAHGEQYNSSYKEVMSSVDTVELFWRTWNNLPKIRDMVGSTYVQLNHKSVNGFSIFEKGVLPEWEDKENKNGCELWSRFTVPLEQAEHLWMNVCLLIVGGSLSESVTGARFIVKSFKQGRMNAKLEIWLRTSDAAKLVMSQLVHICRDLSFLVSSHRENNHSKK